MSLFASIAQVVPATEAEGPGRRFALWFQGCPLRCPGCCNPEMLTFDGGQTVAIDELCAQLLAAKHLHGVEGLTLLGGEPFAHADAAAALANFARRHDLSVMVFSGYVVEELHARAIVEPAVAALLDGTDILVDGPYVRELPDTSRRWIGSTNQRIHFLTGRYCAEDPCWRASNTLELRWRDGELTVNGFPSPQAKPLWKRG